MRVFLAGGISGNMSPFFHDLKEWSVGGASKAMQIFLAGNNGRWDIVEEVLLKIYLAGVMPCKNGGGGMTKP